LTWGDTISALEAYWERDPYDKAIMKPKMTAHTTDKSYQMAFKLKSDLPSKSLYYLTRVLGNKQ